MTFEHTMLSVKFLMFFALEFAVFALVGAVVIGGLYQLVCSKVRRLSLPASEVETSAALHS